MTYGLSNRPVPARAAGLRLNAPAALALLGTLAFLQACSGGGGGTGGGLAEENLLEDSLFRWNQIAIDASGLDHAPSNVGPPHESGAQVGPCRAARAMAIVHIAMFEVVNAVRGGYVSYLGMPPETEPVSLRAAIAQAAHDTLADLFPSQAYLFDGFLSEDLARVRPGPAFVRGVELGREAANGILTLVADDGSNHPEPLINIEFICGEMPGWWRQDPVSQHPLALGAHWYTVRPLVMQSSDQFRVPPPPALTSPEHTAAYQEALAFGGDGITTPTQRTEEQTFIGNYWAYDGTPSLCAPPRLYNQLVVHLARQENLGFEESARLLAVMNVALCEAGIAVWESKFFYQTWRPVAGIRESDPGTGPTGRGDGNPNTIGDPTFMPLGAPASNLSGPNFTPPFPSYPSGHGGFGGALFQVLRRFFGTDDIAFTFVSDEYNGVTRDSLGQVRPLQPRSFTSFSQAEEENGQSRIYLGIHWAYDKTSAITQGRAVGNYVFDNVFQPVN